MIRRTIITTLTVLACLMLVLEDLSYRLYFMKELESTNEIVRLEIHRGKLRIDRVRDVPDTLDDYNWHCSGLRVADRIGVDWYPLQQDAYSMMARPADRRLTEFELPLWMPLVLFAVYPGLAFLRGPLRRWRRRKRGGCRNCGYDLKGNVSGVCPECGQGM